MHASWQAHRIEVVSLHESFFWLNQLSRSLVRKMLGSGSARLEHGLDPSNFEHLRIAIEPFETPLKPWKRLRSLRKLGAGSKRTKKHIRLAFVKNTNFETYVSTRATYVSTRATYVSRRPNNQFQKSHKITIFEATLRLRTKKTPFRTKRSVLCDSIRFEFVYTAMEEDWKQYVSYERVCFV